MCMCDLFACVCAWGVSVYSLIRRTFLESAQNLTLEKSRDMPKNQTHNGCPSMLWPRSVVLNLIVTIIMYSFIGCFSAMERIACYKAKDQTHTVKQNFHEYMQTHAWAVQVLHKIVPVWFRCCVRSRLAASWMMWAAGGWSGVWRECLTLCTSCCTRPQRRRRTSTRCTWCSTGWRRRARAGWCCIPSWSRAACKWSVPRTCLPPRFVVGWLTLGSSSLSSPMWEHRNFAQFYCISVTNFSSLWMYPLGIYMNKKNVFFAFLWLILCLHCMYLKKSPVDFLLEVFAVCPVPIMQSETWTKTVDAFIHLVTKP